MAAGPKCKAFTEAYQKTYKVDRIASPLSAVQGYDSMYPLMAAIRQAGATDGLKVREARENLQQEVDGVVTVNVHPFAHEDHDAIEPGEPVRCEVASGRLIRALRKQVVGALAHGTIAATIGLGCRRCYGEKFRPIACS